MPDELRSSSNGSSSVLRFRHVPTGFTGLEMNWRIAVTNGTTRETVRLSKLLKENGAFHLLAELGTKPRVVYLPPKGRNYDFPGKQGKRKKRNRKIKDKSGWTKE